MESFYGWIRNIVFYLIFITMITNLLPSGKYEKYLRLFSGCILILLVIQPLTGTFRLDEQITALFHSFSFENDAGELSRGIDEMEKKRMSALINQYEQTTAGDIKRLAAMEGLDAKEVSVQIVGDQNSPDFGRLKNVTVILAGEDKSLGDAGSTNEEKEKEPAVQKVDLVDPVNIRVDLGDSGKSAAVQPEQSGQQDQAGQQAPQSGTVQSGQAESAGRKPAEQDGADSEERNRQSAAASAEAAKLRQQISGCYQVEVQNVEIKHEND